MQMKYILIKKLKEAKVALTVASEFDYCPGPDEVDEVDSVTKDLILPEWVEVKKILEEYEGFSPSDIETRIHLIISKLEL